MKDPNNREIMARLYRLVERYETAPEIIYADDAEKYFNEVLEECRRIYDEFYTNEFAREFTVALYNALGNLFKYRNQDHIPLKDRPPEGEQQSMF